MALTLFRWVAIAIGGALVAAAYFLTPLPERQRTVDQRAVLERWEGRLGQMASGAAGRLRVLQIRDSVQSVLARMPKPDSVRILFDRSMPAPVRQALGNLAARAQSGTPAQWSLPIDVVFVFDTGVVVRGVNRGYGVYLVADYVLPRSSSERCLVIARIRPPRDEGMTASQRARILDLNQDITRRRLLGPCAFVGAFGVPGEQVDRWLFHRGWTYGVIADWTRDFPRWQPPSWVGEDMLGANTGWPLRDYISHAGYRCVAGDGDSCINVLLNGVPSRRQRNPQMWGNRIVSSGGLTWNWWWNVELGPNQGALLSEMARDIGSERFRQFWTSPLPVEEAFRSATGQDLGDWTRTWAASEYGSGRGRGPAIPPVGAAIALGLVALAVGAAMWASQRRQTA